jgi:integrase
MKQAKAPSKPRKYRKKGRQNYYAAYWQDKLDDDGNIVRRQQIQITLVDEDGQPITTPRRADKACDRLYEQLSTEWNGRPTETTSLDDYKNRYVSARSRRQGTSRSYETKLRQFLEYLVENHAATQFKDIRREMVKAYLDDRTEDVKLVTVHGDLRAIRAFFNEAVKDGHLKDNISKGIKLPKLTNRASEGFFLPSEMDAIVEYCRECEPKWHGIFAGFRYAPFRREELCYLEWSDLDLDRDVIRIQNEKQEYNWRPKRTGRTMDLHPAFKAALENVRSSGSFVFAHPDGATFDDVRTERYELGRKAWRKIKTLCDHLNLAEKDESGSWDRRFPNGAHLKAFRAGVSCELQLKGAPLAYVQEQLGHHDNQLTLEHYTHLVPELMGSLTKQFIGYLGNDSKQSG